MNPETLWHVTVLSNFAKGYDKYARRYSKAALPLSTFPDQFFLLRGTELTAGVRKAGGLLARLGMVGDRLIALQTVVPAAELRENTRTGIGRYVERGWITLTGVAWVGADGARHETSIEEMMAESLNLMQHGLGDFAALRPRSFSVLPVARGCQAACPFCFSDASASAEQDQARLDLEKVARHAAEAARLGAERFVITGGGEPGLVRHELLIKLIRAGGGPLGKAVLITNGHHLARHDDAARTQMLAECRTLNGCRTGEAKITQGYCLKARHVIHTAGPVWHGGGRKEPELLRACYENSLKLAAQHGLRSIAFPCISTGVYRFPPDRAAQIAVEAVRGFLAESSSIERVIFCCFGGEDSERYQSLLRAST